MKLISSWSGGKDSCLALYKALQKGEEVCLLLNFISEEYQRCCFHGLASELMIQQAQALDIPIRQVAVPADMQEYEKKFKLTVNHLMEKEKIQGMIFGDVYLEEHKSWVDRVCQELKIIPIQPLWNIPAEKVVAEFVAAGFRALVVSAKADLFDQDFLGRQVDYELIKELTDRKICPCGENGEFHTFVYDGPIFKKKISIKKTEKILKAGFWKHWFLDIRDYAIEKSA
ncbi:MAG: diphthine--ammonia ligase [Thermodesulfobacteriota bacterium]